MSTPSETNNSTPSSVATTTQAAPVTSATTTDSTPTSASAINSETPAVFTPDPAKSADENAAAKVLFDAKATETKSAEVKPAAPPASVTAADIKVPEGFKVDEPLMKDFLGIVNDAVLTPAARTQALLDLQVKAVTQLTSQMQEQWNTAQTENRAKIAADRELSAPDGNLHPKVSALFDAGFKKFGGAAESELRKAFDATGAGNNPLIVRYVHSLLSALGEGSLVPGGKPGPSGSGGVKTDAEIAASFYDKK